MSRISRWQEGPVDRKKQHFELRYGSADTGNWDTWVPVAVIGPPVRTDSLTVRIDPRVKYLAEIAAKARGCTLTSYLESVLEESFKKVTLRVPPEPEPMYGDGSGNWTMPKPPREEEERAANEAMSIANLADKLWKESDFQRLQSLNILAPHILPKEDHALLQYLHSRNDLKIPATKNLRGGYKLNREKIIKEWEVIKKAFKVQK